MWEFESILHWNLQSSHSGHEQRAHIEHFQNSGIVQSLPLLHHECNRLRQRRAPIRPARASVRRPLAASFKRRLGPRSASHLYHRYGDVSRTKLRSQSRPGGFSIRWRFSGSGPSPVFVAELFRPTGVIPYDANHLPAKVGFCKRFFVSDHSQLRVEFGELSGVKHHIPTDLSILSRPYGTPR